MATTPQEVDTLETAPDDCGGAEVVSRAGLNFVCFCEGCGNFSLEFGTLCVRLTPRQLRQMLNASEELLRRLQEGERPRTFGIAIGGSCAAIRLNPDELVSLHRLLRRGFVNCAERLATTSQASEVVN